MSMTQFGIRPAMVNYTRPTTVLVRKPDVPRRPGAATIEAVCRERRINKHDLLGPRKWTHLVDARMDVACRLRDEHGLKKAAIGRILHRDHSTIRNLFKRQARMI